MTIPWNPPAPYRGRHRAPKAARPVLIDEARILDDYAADFARHALDDGRPVHEALTLAGIDADDRLLAWQVTS